MPPSVPGTIKIFQSDVGECSAHHHIVTTATCTEGVEILLCYAMFGEVFRSRSVLGEIDPAGEI
jgi:hypothetical protein